MRSGDHLADLFRARRPARRQVEYRQGTVVSWNPATVHNTIRIAGADLSDLPILTAAVDTMRVGSAVAVLQIGGSHLVLGTITTPNDE